MAAVNVSAVKLEAVSKRYRGGPPVLVDIDLAIRPGAVVAVAGGNGSGKSTLLRILAGLSRATSGLVSGIPEVVGYVPERFPAGTRLSANAYLEHMGRVKGLSTQVAAARAAELLDALGLVGAAAGAEAGAHTPLRQLSKGNAQKVALAQALLVAPELLVLDEPWSGLDAAAHGVLGELIGGVAARDGAVVFTDHREAVRVLNATEVFELSGGRLSAAPASRPVSRSVTWSASASGSASSSAAIAVLRIAEADRLHGLAALGAGGAGVLAAEQDHDELRVEVLREQRDALLLAALQRGWSVEEVRHTR